MRGYLQKYGFLSVLDHFDIFRFRPTFVLNSKEKASTITGKIITIGILIFLLYSLNESNVMNKTNPNTLSQDIRLKTRPSFWFSKENFTLVVGLADENNNFLNDNTFFSIYLKLISVNNTDHTSQETSIILKPCLMEDFKENPKEFQELGLKGSFCLPSSILKLNGYWDEETIEYFYFEVRTCRNFTLSNIICQPKELIIETLNNYYLDFYITDHNVDSSNYLAPLSRDLKIYFKQLDLSLKKSLTIFMKRTWIDSDDGFFFESHKIIKTFGPGQVDFDVISNYGNEDLIFVITVYSSEFETNIFRNYQKIQTLLAQLGGICNFLFFFGFVASKFENRFRLITILGNELFIFPKSNHPRLKKKNSKKSTKMDTSHNLVLHKSPTIMKASKEEQNSRGRESNDFKTIAPEKPENDKDPPNNSIPILKASSPLRIQPKYLDENEPQADFHESLVSISNDNKDKSICDPPNIKVSQTLKPHTTLSIKNKIKNMWEMGKSQLKRANNNTKTTDNIVINNLEHYQRMKNKENFFSIGFWGFIKILLKSKKCFLTMKEKLFMMSEAEITDQMDILNILKKLQDIDKLKRILLSEEQLYLFNLVSKPMIVLDGTKKELKKPVVVEDKRFRFSMAEKPKLEKNKLMTNYELVRNNSDKSEIDQRILKLLDEDVLSFLKHES